jgi:hypothetical protein
VAEIEDLYARLSTLLPSPPSRPVEPPRPLSGPSGPLSTGNVDMSGVREYMRQPYKPEGMQMFGRMLQPPAQPKNQGQLPAGSYDKWQTTPTGNYTQQIYPRAADAGFGDTTALANRLQTPRYGRDSAPEMIPGMGGKPQDPNRLPYEEEPLRSAQETKGGRLDRMPQQQKSEQDNTGLAGLITPDMKQVIRQMVQRNPALAQHPQIIGNIIMKMMPFMHKRQQEQYQRLREEHAVRREEHTQRMEGFTQERADRAQRLEGYKMWLDQVRDKHAEAKDAWARLKDVQDPTKDFAGDRPALIKRYTDEYEAAETERKKLQSANPYQQKGAAREEGGKADASFAKGQQGDPGAAPALTEKAHGALTGQFEKGIAKAQTALSKAKSLDERNLILGNTLRYVGAAREEAGLPPLTEAEKEAFVISQPSHDTRTYGEQAEDWLGHKAQEYFPTAYRFYQDMQSFEPSMWDDPLSPNRIIAGLNPMAAESQYAHGLRKARGMESSAAEMERNESSSYPERALGGLRALGGVAAPVATAANPLGATAIGGIGNTAEQVTGSPWAGLGAMLAAGGGLGGLERQARAGAPPPPRHAGPPPQPNVAGGMGAGAYSNPMQGMMGGQPFAPSTQGMGGAMPPMQNQPVPGMQRLPPPGPAGPSRGPMPGSFTGAGPTTRPKAGLYGKPPIQGEQRPIEMGPPGAQFRMPPPREPLQLAPPRAPEPSGPVQRGEAAADIAAGKEHPSAVPPSSKPLQPTGGPYGVNQFGDHTVGDTVRFNGRTRVIEELIPARPGHLAPKAKLAGLKLPVTLTKLEPVSMAKAGRYAEGDRVKWDLPAGFGSASGVIQKVTTSAKGRAMATVKRSDGQVVDVSIDSLKNV